MQARAPTPSASTPSIGKVLLAILAERRWKLNDLARHSGISASQLSLLTRDIIVAPRVSTIRALCTALEIDPSVLAFTDRPGRRTADLRATEGVTTAPVVRLTSGGGWVEVGQNVAITAAQLSGRQRLFVAVIDGGGMAPHVLTGDRLLFDPDEPAQPEQLVLLRYRAATTAAWRLLQGDRLSYWLSDGSQLDEELCQPVGVVVYIMRQPPACRGPYARPSYYGAP
jgi:DNA-binding Xre family transcriptional regulator